MDYDQFQPEFVNGWMMQGAIREDDNPWTLSLDAAIYCTGDVRYQGEARVKSQVYGTGEVEKK